MQNAEIQQRVINLVELYRTKVGKESQIAKEAKEDHDYWDQVNMDMAIEAHEAGLPSFSGMYGEGPHTEEWIKHLKVNEQLLGHFYAEVAGEDADKETLDQMLPDVYDKTIFTEEEESFLKLHFREMVNYIIKTPCNESLELVNRYDSKDTNLIPEEVLDLVSSRISISDEATIYNPFAGFAQFTNLYPGRKFLCEESYEAFNKRWNAFCEAANISDKAKNIGMLKAWMKLALFANKIDVKIIEDGHIPERYDAVLSYLPQVPVIEENAAFAKVSIEELTVASQIASAYLHLNKGGVMGLLIPRSQLFENEKRTSQFKAFTDMLIKEDSLAEIIQLPSVMSTHHDFCLLVAKKGLCDTTTLIDARFAGKDSPKKDSPKVLDMALFNAMMQNSGKEVITGLRKIVQVPMQSLNSDLLLPQAYVVEKPYDVEHPLPLSKLGKLATTRIRDLQFDLPEETPWVELKDLSLSFKGNLDITILKKADCPNNPPYIEGSKDYTFSPNGKFVDNHWAQMYSKKGFHVCEYRSCTYLDGKKEAVLFWPTDKGVGTAIVSTSDRAIAVGQGIKVFLPKDGIDALTVVATLRLPVVHRQLQAYDEFGLAKHLDDILVPTDKRIIYDEKQRMQKEQDVVGGLEEKLSNKERSLRMRKHALTQSLSSFESMFYALNAYRIRKEGKIADDDVISRVKVTTVHEAFEFLSQSIKDMMPALEHIADVEYSFSKPEWIDPEKFMEEYIKKNEKGWLNFKPITTWKQGHNQATKDFKDPLSGDFVLREGDSINQFLFPKDALEHVFKDIISNAKAHGFKDETRNDYQLRFSWHMDGMSLVVEIENNGTHIPSDRDTASLLEYGVSTVLNQDGHNGIGCNEINDIMLRYDGKVEIVSLPENEFPVKYILTFNRSNTIRSF